MAEIIQRSFTGGELAPAMRSRADLTKYSNGLALCQNAIIRPQGGVYSRQGLRFVDEIGDSTKRPRLLPFSFNTEQTYILVFEENTIRFVRDGGYVLENDAITIYEIASPYLESELPRLSVTQRADVMTIVHPNHPVKNLSRTADNVWSLDDVDFAPTIQPPEWVELHTFNISNITNANPAVVTSSTAHTLQSGQVVRIGAVTGMTQVNDESYVVTVIDSTNFSLDDTDSTSYSSYTSGGQGVSGGAFAFGDGAGDFDKNYTYVVTAVNADGEESVASSRMSLTTPSLSTTAGVRLMWEAVEGATYYRLYKEASRFSRLYGWIGDSTNLSFDDFNIAPLTADAPPRLSDPFTELTGNITGLNMVSEIVVESAGHLLATGDTVLIEGILQPTNFNDQSFPISVIDDNNFTIHTGLVGPFNVYTSGGTFTREAQRPATVSYYQQRQFFANTTTQSQTVYGSQVGNYNSLRTSVPVRDDDAVSFTIAGEQVNEIRHLIEMNALIVLTSGGEWRVTEGQDQVLTPATLGVRKQSQNGASWVPPVIVDDTILYMQDKGARLRDINYDFGTDKFKGNDLSITSEHLFEGHTIVEMAYTDEPYGIVWAVRDDGVLLGLTYQREHQVWAWHQHTTLGTFESVASISEDGRDALYAVVNRTIDGNVKRYIERMEKRVVSSPEDVFCVDSGLTYDGASTTTISGLSHLEGESVAVVADGNVVTGLTVVSGAITLPNAASKASVGLPYTVAIETLDIDIGELKQTLKARSVSIAKVVIEFQDSRGCWVGPIKDVGVTDMTEIKPRFDFFDYNSIPLRSYYDEVIVEPTWNRGGGLRIEQRDPMPMAILSITPEVDF